MKYYATELYEARVERTIDPKLWASVSSGCSKTYKADLGNSARVPSGTADQLLARYVAGLIILKQKCPMSMEELKNSTAFRPWGQKLAQLGVDIARVQQLWNENCGRLPQVQVGSGNPASTPMNQEPVMDNEVNEIDPDDFQLGDINVDQDGNTIPTQRTPRYIPKDRKPKQEYNPDDDYISQAEPVDEPEPDEDEPVYGDAFDEDDEVEPIEEPVEPEEVEEEPENTTINYSMDDDISDPDDEPEPDEDMVDYTMDDDIEDEEPVNEIPDEVDNEPDMVDEEPEVEDEPDVEDEDDYEPEPEPETNDRPGIAEYSNDPKQQVINIHNCLIKSRKRVFPNLYGCGHADDCMIPVADLTKGTGIVSCENRDEAVEALNQPGGVCYKMKVYNGDPEEVQGDILWSAAPIKTEYYVIVNDQEARIYYKEATGELSLTWEGSLADFGFKV